jgi:diguanylate cyclase (GGDEF)-like protein/PAS domain S-box-containing protein
MDLLCISEKNAIDATGGGVDKSNQEDPVAGRQSSFIEAGSLNQAPAGPEPMWPTEPLSNIDNEIQYQKTNLLFRSAGPALGVNIVNAAFLALVNAALHVSALVAVAWWCSVVMISSGRYLLVRRFHTVKPSAADSIIWRNRYIGATTLVATAWGAGTILFMWHAPDPALLFTGLVLAGMVAGAVPILAPVPAAFRIFALVVVIPLVAVLLLQATSLLHGAFALVALVFLVTVLVSARYFHETLETSIRLGLEQRHLAENLRRARDAAESALGQRKQAEATLQASESRFRALFEQSPDPTWILRDNRVTESNQAAVREFRYIDKQAFISTHPSEFSPEVQPDGENSYKKAERMIAIAVERGIHRFEWMHRRADGSTFCAEVTLAPMLLDGLPSINGVVRNITDRKQAEAALMESERRYREVFQTTLDAINLTRADDGRYVDINPAFTDITGFERNEVIGHTGLALNLWVDPTDRQKLLEVLRHDGKVRNQEVLFRKRDGTTFWGLISAVEMPLMNERYILAITRDITEYKRAEAQIEHLAYHDQLTNLPNRALFLDRLGQALASARRAQRFGAVMFVDLDHFKRINDVHNHTIGDMVLKDVAQRLRYFLRQGDTVARLGGDEFVILLPELSTDQEMAATLALSVGEKVRAALEQPARIDGQDYLTTASIGVSLFPKQSESVEDLIREADIAMYRAKDSGRNALIFFEQHMQTHIAERYALERDLRGAVKQSALELFVQSQVTVDGEVIGAEALVRWHHPSRGLVSPASFIPIAEETGLIVGIGEWVLHEACRLLAQLNESGHSLRIAVNVSPRQFHQANFVTRVQEILAKTGADPLYLTLEITESLLIDRTAEVVSRMMALSELGIRFSIDDFGTGYSSLAYLKRLPLNELKIDKSFVQDVPNDPNDVALVETIMSMARHLHFEVVAEGVETRAQLEFLTGQGCGHFQGYFFHRPQPSRDWLAHLNDPTPWASAQAQQPA